MISKEWSQITSYMSIQLLTIKLDGDNLIDLNIEEEDTELYKYDASDVNYAAIAVYKANLQILDGSSNDSENGKLTIHVEYNGNDSSEVYGISLPVLSYFEPHMGDIVFEQYYTQGSESNKPDVNIWVGSNICDYSISDYYGGSHVNLMQYISEECDKSKCCVGIKSGTMNYLNGGSLFIWTPTPYGSIRDKDAAIRISDTQSDAAIKIADMEAKYFICGKEDCFNYDYYVKESCIILPNSEYKELDEYYHKICADGYIYIQDDGSSVSFQGIYIEYGMERNSFVEACFHFDSPIKQTPAGIQIMN